MQTAEERKEYQRQYYLKNRDYLLKKRHELYVKQMKDPEYRAVFLKRSRAYSLKWLRKNRERQRQRRYEIRQKVLQKLGGRCVQCGYDANWRALQIDHIIGGGRIEREKITQHGLHAKILKMDLKEVLKTYQCLCANCNWIKKYKERENNNEGRPVICD